MAKIENKGNTKDIRIDNEDDNVASLKIKRQDDLTSPSKLLLLNNINVNIWYKIGDEIEVDASCDSGYMLSAMNRVGEAIRKSYQWIPISQKCYLVMDNTGGHSTNEAITSYTNTLEEENNIETIFQIPRSSYTNILDLGVWMSLQVVV